MSTSATAGLSHDPASPLEGRVDLRQLWSALARRWYWIVIPTLLAFIGSIVFVNVVSPRYTGEAKLLLQPADTFFMRGSAQDRVDQQQLFDEQAIASQVQVVMSRDLAREAIKQLQLVGNPEFDPLVGGMGLLRRLGVLLGFAQNPLDRAPEERVADRYFERLVVYPVGKSRIVAIEFRARDPDLAARGANTIAELYLNLQDEAKKDTARSASTWLGGNIDPLRQRVAEAEAKVEEFRTRTGLLGTNNVTLISQTLADLNAQLGQARNAETDAQAKAKLIRELIRSQRTLEIPDVANNELVRRLFEQRVSLRTQLALESRTLLPGHPRMKELNAQLGDLENQIRSATERVVRTLENDARLSRSRLDSITAAIDAQKKLVGQANENEVQLRALEREARTQRDQLEAYLTRYREATARNSENASPPDARIISRAVAPQEPSFPKKLPIVILATVAAAMVAAGTILALELLGSRPVRPDGRLVAQPFPVARTEAHAPPVPRAPVAPEPLLAPRAAVVAPPPMAIEASTTPASSDGELTPAATTDLPAPVFERVEPDEFAQRYDFSSLGARLERIQVGSRGRRLLVTGVESAADAAAVARGLGRHLAKSHRTILVDFDQAFETAGMPVLGFTDLVSGDATFVEVIEREPNSRLHRVGLGTHEALLMADERDGVALSLSAFDQTYEWVICLVRESRSAAAFDVVVPLMDVVVIASNHEPAAHDLVAAYEAAKGSGAAEVVVAREQGLPQETMAAA